MGPRSGQRADVVNPAIVGDDHPVDTVPVQDVQPRIRPGEKRDFGQDLCLGGTSGNHPDGCNTGVRRSTGGRIDEVMGEAGPGVPSSAQPG